MPVTIMESWRVMSRGRVTVYPTRVRVRLGPPIASSDYDRGSMGRLADDVRESVVAHYSENPASAGTPSGAAGATPGAAG